VSLGQGTLYSIRSLLTHLLPSSLGKSYTARLYTVIAAIESLSSLAIWVSLIPSSDRHAFNIVTLWVLIALLGVVVILVWVTRFPEARIGFVDDENVSRPEGAYSDQAGHDGGSD
jgi:hypothetical protein